MDLFSSTGNWIEALGKTLIHSIWIALLIYSMLRILLHTIPDRYSNLRYKMAILSMLSTLACVTSLFFLIYTPELAFALSDDPARSDMLLPFLQEHKAMVSQEPNLQLPFVICTYIYLAGIPIVLIRSAISMVYLRRIRKTGIPVQQDWLVRLNQLKASLGIQRKVAFLETNKLNTPALIGCIKPAVLVPAGMLTNLPVSQIETILLHELFHLRRFDTLVNVVQLIIENLFFYNPAVWAISNAVRQEREKCCDDSVLDSCEDPLIYVRALYQLAGKDHQLSTLATGAGGKDRFQLYNRIQRILNPHAMKNNIRERLFSLLILAGGLLIMLTITGFSSGFSMVKDNEAWQKASYTQNPVTPPQAEPAPLPMEEPAPLPPAEPVPAIEPMALSEPRVLLPPLADTIPDVNWEEIKQEMEEAHMEAMEEMANINWEEIREDMEKVRMEAMEEMANIDWEEIKKEMEKARTEVMENIDWDEIRIEMKDFEINFDSLKMDFDFDMDMDWEAMKEDMAKAKIHLDSLLRDMKMDFDMNFDMDMDAEKEE